MIIEDYVPTGIMDTLNMRGSTETNDMVGTGEGEDVSGLTENNDMIGTGEDEDIFGSR